MRYFCDRGSLLVWWNVDGMRERSLVEVVAVEDIDSEENGEGK